MDRTIISVLALSLLLNIAFIYSLMARIWYEFWKKHYEQKRNNRKTIK
jgi:hypothetical protein